MEEEEGAAGLGLVFEDKVSYFYSSLLRSGGYLKKKAINCLQQIIS